MASLRTTLLRTAFGVLAAPLAPAFAADPPARPAAPSRAVGADPQAPAAQPDVRLGGALDLADIEVVARRLDEARLSIQPSLGATRTDFSRQAIETIPQGDNAGLNQIL